MTPAPFQVTVHLSGFSVPNWLPGAVMYQIFPDRFNRGSDYSYERMVSLGDYSERIWHEDWNSEVDIHGKSETGYIACDFYGGSLRGIIEKLDYIANLGIDVIYLNPIFRARSNHRYDTGDYEQIDPLVGTEDDLRELCSLAQDRGIRVMLDGVFSHTGADSRYFNKLSRYDSNGAWQEAVDNNGEKHCSDYSSWYSFHRRGNDLFYDSWWGFPDLPSVNEHDLTYRHYMTGDNGIIAKWLSAGVSGWRLDVLMSYLTASFAMFAGQRLRQDRMLPFLVRSGKMPAARLATDIIEILFLDEHMTVLWAILFVMLLWIGWPDIIVPRQCSMILK